MSESIRPWLRWIALGAVILVPLAFAGLFVGAVSGADTATSRIPAAIVNEDTLIYQTAADGSETPVFAGRQLVTELTADDSFDWTITNASDADRALASGEVFAILTVPQDFSRSILSLSGDSPRQAAIDIRTNDAHSYLTGALSESVGESMADAFGTAITEQYIAGIYSGMGELGTSLGSAADGAGELSSGAAGLNDGLLDLSTGAASAGAGAASLSSGIDGYTRGVESLSSGLASLSAGAGSLSQVGASVTSYTGQISSLAQALAAATADLATAPSDPAKLATVQHLSALLGDAAAGGSQLGQGTTGAVSQVQGGIASSAAGAAKLSAGSASLRSGASSVASGLGGLSSGAASAASGAGDLATGASELAAGLRSGADQVPTADAETQAASAELAADPVGLTVTRDNKISAVGQAIASFFVPLGLWVGALAIFLVLRPLTRSVLASTARTRRLLGSMLGRASLVAVAQALVLVGLLHLALDVSWSLLPATLGFSLITALAFTAFHYLLTAALGRAGLVVSLLALAIQLASTGGLYPIQLLAEPFQALSPLLPLTYAVNGMQGIIAGGGAAPVVGAALALAGFGIVSVLLSGLAIRRNRRASALRLAPAAV